VTVTVDLGALIGSLRVIDIVLLLLFAGGFLIGFFQGLMRQLAGIFAWFMSFLLAANIRDPLAGWLGNYWTQYSPEYVQMLAFGILYVVFLVVANIGLQLAMKRAPLFAHMSFVDELVGGALGVVLTIVIVAAGVIVVDDYYAGAEQNSAEVSWVADLEAGFDESAIVRGMRNSLAPGLLAVLGPLVPMDVRPGT
jgi:uncharacterized membrane protein required for colicin V production